MLRPEKEGCQYYHVCKEAKTSEQCPLHIYLKGYEKQIDEILEDPTLTNSARLMIIQGEATFADRLYKMARRKFCYFYQLLGNECARIDEKRRGRETESS